MRNRFAFAVMFISLLLAAAPGSPLANMGEDDVPVSKDTNYQEGKRAIEAEDWAKAIELLRKAIRTEPTNADAHNFLGYAYRKTRQLDASLAQYKEALKLNPNHKNAHEYIGEAYLLTDNLPAAERHLAELQKLCTPIPCEEYKALKRAVDAYLKAKK